MELGLRHWRCSSDQNHILWVTFDKADGSVNALSVDVFDELSQILQWIETHDDRYAGVVFQSGKKSGFIAGADIVGLQANGDPNSAIELIQKGQPIFRQLASISLPTIALIDGFCLGGGLELALACDYRIAIDKSSTKIGLPEVKLGIQPGWGGSVRLPRLIGALKAFPLMLAGRVLSASQAKRVGMVDTCVPERQGLNAVRYLIQVRPNKRKLAWYHKVLHQSFVRPYLGKLLKWHVKKKARQAHYPAPFQMIDNFVKYGVNDDMAFDKETLSISNLIVTDSAKSLFRVFALQEHLKSLAKPATDIKHLHVIGAGVMGGDIAAWAALRGLTVTLQDNDVAAIGRAYQQAIKLFKKKLKQPLLIREAMDRLQPDPSGDGLPKADMIIEAIIEDLQVKQKLFSEVESLARPDAIIATNTSSISLEEICKGMHNRTRLVGVHFFNPVAKMQLVEIVSIPRTQAEVISRAMGFVRTIDKLPLPVANRPGFLVNRVLMPYLMESVLMVEEGIPPVLIDEAALQFGMPMGPIELADTVGLDICLSVAEEFEQHFDRRVPEILKDKVNIGEFGRKSGRGFYAYRKGKAVKKRANKKAMERVDMQLMQDRLVLSMLNETVACLREGVVRSEELLDAGMIFGTGFAPFRGGPMHYVRRKTTSATLQTLVELKKKYGPRFSADQGWVGLER